MYMRMYIHTFRYAKILLLRYLDRQLSAGYKCQRIPASASSCTSCLLLPAYLPSCVLSVRTSAVTCQCRMWELTQNRW